MATGTLITVEGIDGAGKSTLVGGLVAALADRRIDVTVLREPGGVVLSERIRELVKDPSLHVDPRAEALLYAAARAQLVAERLRPLLEDGKLVLLDRYVDSSLAYQGAGRKLGVEEIRSLNLFATGGLTPTLTLLLKIDPEQGLSRVDGRKEGSDRLEQEKTSFFADTAKAYDQLAAEEPNRIKVIDAHQTPEGVLADSLAAVAPLLRNK